MNPTMQECIDECVNCHRVCLETFTQHCLKMGGAHVEQHHARLMLDCIQICQTSADFMIRGSELHKLTCSVCAEICRRCAEDCARFSDAEMLRCAETCSRCAQTCSAMAGQQTREMAAV
ncbi:MAG: uncharacterized protein JWL77_3083 [Chthonomonadaceae bacterium]|nr:uncharacterized protein [Chthonomonadaceae bacterium]